MPQPGPGAPLKRNDPCPCGSGKKYKKCCLGRTDIFAVAGSAPASPDDGRTAELLVDAKRHLADGRHFQAIPLLQEIVGRDPRHREALVQLGVAFGRAGNLTHGVRFLRRAVAAGDDDPQTHGFIAGQLMTLGRPDEALPSAERALALDPGDTRCRHVLAQCLEVLGRSDEAMEQVEKILATDPDQEVALLRARLLRRRGDLEEAQRTLAPLLTLDHHAFRYVGHAWQELGQIHDKRGEYDLAFEAFGHAARERERVAGELEIDGAWFPRRIRGYRSSDAGDLFERWTRDTFDDDLPIPGFLVGFPRSGTTLMEQILGAHPKIVTSNELPLLDPLRNDLKKHYRGSSDLLKALGRLDRDHIAALRSLYWKNAEITLDEQIGDRTLVHKNPLDIIELALINVVFPEARVIVAIRDPRDTCLSCFMQMFAPNEAMVNFVSWDRTIRFYAEVMGLWLHQRPMLRIRTTEVMYEELVDDLEREARRMLDTLGVEWDERVLRYHSVERRRAVNTPSYTGVSSPVYRSATARWRKYGRHIDEVREKLAPFIEAFGYSLGAPSE